MLNNPEIKTKYLGYGLLPLPPDNLDFKYEKVFGAVQVPETDFTISEPLYIEDQKGSDYCGAYASSSGAEDHEGIDLDPIFSFAAIKKIDGKPEGWGANLRDIMKAGTKIGFLEKTDAIFTVDDDREKIVHITNYPTELIDKALKHRQESYFSISSGFEGFRQALWQNRARKRSIITGVSWRGGWSEAPNGIIPVEATEQYFGHAIKIYGQKNIDGKLYLVAQLSNGKGIGEGGIFYFPKEVIDRDFNFGAYCYVDMGQEEAQKKSWSWWDIIVNFIKKLWQKN